MKNIHTKFYKLILRKKQPIVTGLLLSLVVVGYQNCQQNEDYFKMAEVSAIATPVADVLPPEQTEGQEPAPEVNPCANGSSTDLICNPLGGDQPIPTARSGLIANLYEGKYNFNSINIYLTDGYKHPESIYFSNFNVPARSFDQGFSIGENDFLKTQTGSKLIEWFAIEATGNITLPADQEEGFYHIVTISDDGILVKVDGKTLISNPSPHAPMIDCSKELVELVKGKEKSFELTYYQGPRYQIALMTFIKKVDPATYAKSNLCGTANGPDALKKQGYSVISPEWFTLPAGY
jgi:hypothetical protein